MEGVEKAIELGYSPVKVFVHFHSLLSLCYGKYPHYDSVSSFLLLFNIRKMLHMNQSVNQNQAMTTIMSNSFYLFIMRDTNCFAECFGSCQILVVV